MRRNFIFAIALAAAGLLTAASASATGFCSGGFAPHSFKTSFASFHGHGNVVLVVNGHRHFSLGHGLFVRRVFHNGRAAVLVVNRHGHVVRLVRTGNFFSGIY